jgi:hypothetical protein
MDKFKSVDEIKVLLENKNYTEKEINDFVGFIEPFYDFYDFMLIEHNMDFEQVEEDSSNFSQEVFVEYLEEMSKSESPLNYMLEISGDIMKRYATNYNYSEPEKVKIALTKYMDILVMNQLKK